jgi:hypothetical protein
MTICSHTGLAIPECSCSTCTRALLEQYYVAAASTDPRSRTSVIKRIAARARRTRHRQAA